MSQRSDAAAPAPVRNRKLRLLAAGLVLASIGGAFAFWVRGQSPRGAVGSARALGSEPVASSVPSTAMPTVTESIPDALRAAPIEAVAHVANPNLFVVRFDASLGIAIGSDGTVLRSTDAGQRWLPAVTATDQPLSDLVLHGRTVIAVGAKGTILTSSDGGKRFTLRPTGGTEELRSIVRVPASGHVFVVGDKGTVLSSRDGGQYFQREDSGTLAFLGHVIVAKGSNRVIAAGEHGIVLLSQGDGAWRLVQTGLDTLITSLETLTDGVVFAGTEAGPILRSKDGGETWEPQQVTEADGVFATAFASDPEGRVTVATTRGGQIWSTSDAGASWNVSRLEGAKFLGSLTYVTKHRRFVVIGDDGSTWASDPGGRQWTRSTGLGHTQLDSIAEEPKSGSVVAVGRGGAVFRSTDGGKRWSSLREGIVDYANSVAVAPSGRAIIAAGPHASLARSTDGGRTYAPVTAPVEDTVTFFATSVHPKSGAMLAGGNGNTLIRSTDDGAHWQRTRGVARNIGGFHLHPDGTLLAFTIDEGVLRSTDGGQSWTDTDVPGSVGIASGISPSTGGWVGVGRRGVVYAAEDLGKHFAAHSPGTDADLYHVVEDRRTATLWAVGTDGVVLASTDRGRVWRTVTSGTTESLNRMLVDPKTGHLLIVGNRGVILFSRDAGQSFQTVSGGTSEHLRAIAIDPKTGRYVVAGKNGTLLVSSDGLRWQSAESHSLARFSSITVLEDALIIAGDRLIRWNLGGTEAISP